MATRGFSFKGLVEYVLALKESITGNTERIENLTAADVGAVSVEDAWKEPFKVFGAVDFDTLRDSGFYYVAGALAGSTNAPMNDAVFVRVAGRSGRDWIVQEAFSYYNPEAKYFRVFKSTDVGMPWERYYSTAFKPTPAEIGAAPNKNLFINGDFSVCQRYSSNTPTNMSVSTFYFADRWLCNLSNSKDPKATAEVVKRPANDQGEPYFYLKTFTPDNNTGIHQRVEDVRLMAGKTMTLSIEFKNSQTCNMAAKIACAGQEITVSDSSWDNVPAPPTSWVKKTATFTVPSSWGATDAKYIDVSIGCSDNRAGVWRYRKAKLEYGSVATPFIPDDPAAALSKCLRYFQRFRVKGNISTYSTTNGFLPTVLFKGMMRDIPNVKVTSYDFRPAGSTQWVSGSTTTVSSADVYGCSVVFNKSASSNPFVAGQSGYGFVEGYAEAEF